MRNKRKSFFISPETALATCNEERRLSMKSFVSLSSTHTMNWIAFYMVKNVS